MLKPDQPTVTGTEFIDEANSLFVSQVDPSIFVKAAFLASVEKRIEEEAVRSFSNAIGMDMESCKKELSATAVILTHQLRYFQVEALLMLLVAGACRERPYLGELKRLKGARWHKALKSIAAGEVPKGYGLQAGGSNFDFRNWVIAALCRHTGEHDDSLDAIVTFIVSEAKVLQKKDSFNAFKHGARARSGGMQLLVSQTDEGEPAIPLLTVDELYGVRWLEWAELDQLAYTSSAKEVSPTHDLNRIFFGASLVRLWRDVRLPGFDVTNGVQIPLLKPSDEPIQRFSFTTRLGEAS